MSDIEPTQTAASNGVAPDTQPPARRRSTPAITACIAAALAVRIVAILLAPQHAFLFDHIDYMVWSDWAFEHGPTSLYDLPVNHLINVQMPGPQAKAPVVEAYPGLNPCDYPPLSGYVFWFQGMLWRAVDSEVVTNPVGPDLARYARFRGHEATSRVVNTITARVVNGAVPILADFILAWGVLTLVRTLRAAKRTGAPEITAFALTLLAPPIFLTSAFWTQMDACLACLLVWCVVLLLQSHHGWAGACYGAALLIKAQAILLVPVLLFIAIAAACTRGGSVRHALRLWRTVITAVIVVALLSLPFALANRGHSEGGWLRWFERSYVGPIQHNYPYTTMKAFNIWWLDFLLHNQQAATLDPGSLTFGGLTKATAGMLLTAAAVLIAAIACAWRWRWQRHAWVGCAALILLSAFLWPTRVHERYIYYCLPFWIAMAVVYRPWRPVLVALLIVSTFEVTWYLWLAPPNAAPDAPAQSPNASVWSLILTVMALASFVYALAVLLPWHRLKARTAALAAPPPTKSIFGEPDSPA